MSESSPNGGLDRQQIETLGHVLDQVIPPDLGGRLPGAGELGLAPEVARAIAANPFLLPVLTRALGALEEGAARTGAPRFATLDPQEKGRLLGEVADAEPDFVPALLFPTYVAYYQHPRVLTGLGEEPRPPFPEGYRLPPFDESLLAPVRARGPLLRA